jgi:type IV pilus assembly protein PilY1
VYVGIPDLRWPDVSPFPTGSNKYSDFKKNNKNRDGIVYVGANDGMLHAFHEDTGREVLAYIPNNVYSTDTEAGLHYLTSPNYSHQYYIDQTPSISDVFINTGSGSTAWSSILVGAQRGGGRGLFALDVTDPSTFEEANADDIFMWEFTSSTDADLGYTYSRPQIALGNNGRWLAIFGNGYNDTGSGEAQLFILDIEKGVDGTWSSGDYLKISTKSGTSSDRNGLATPALVDLDDNGTVDRIYAGDLKGQMWVFDLSDTASSGWPATWKLKYTDPLVTAIGNRPITAKPILAKHPTQPDDPSTNAPNVMVFFGTGKYLEESDKKDTTLNHFYGVWDKGSSKLTSANLVQQTFVSGFSDRVLTRNTVNYSSVYGWYFALPDSGERSVTQPVARNNVVFFNSFVPASSPCVVGGYGFNMAVDMATGGSPEEDVLDKNEDGIVDENDRSKDGTKTGVVVGIQKEGYLPEPVFIEDLAYTADDATKVIELRDIQAGRFSWQELIK